MPMILNIVALLGFIWFALLAIVIIIELLPFIIYCLFVAGSIAFLVWSVAHVLAWFRCK